MRVLMLPLLLLLLLLLLPLLLLLLLLLLLQGRTPWCSAIVLTHLRLPDLANSALSLARSSSEMALNTCSISDRADVSTTVHPQDAHQQLSKS
jgi:hypothetical protein